MQIRQFDDNQSLEHYFSKYLQDLLLRAIADRDEAYLVVSGGKTPIGLFHQLSALSLPWEKVIVTLTDDRCLPATHEDSNTLLVKNNLLINKAKKARLLSLRDEMSTLPCFDAVILGMGEDGHTASIFPCSEDCERALTTTESIITLTPKHAPYDRITMTKSRLINARELFLHIQGAKKWQVFQEAREGVQYPIQHFLNHQNFCVIYAES